VPERSAYAPPRRTIPTAATKNGIESVDAIDPNIRGYPVQSTVNAKISHTWFVSHTGPMEWCAWARMRRACSPRPAVSCHSPAPKSAPPSTM
jgi:hypothetical protein